MPHDALLVLWLIGPVAALTLLRINATAVFIGLCLGVVLARYASNAGESIVGIFSAHLSSFSASSVQIGLLFAPACVVAFLTLFSVRGRMRMLWNIVPAACVSLFGVLTAVPLLGPGLRHGLETQSLWPQLGRYEGLAAVVGVVLACLFLAGRRGGFRSNEKGRRRE